ncbi:ATP synthase D chain (ATP5H) [Gracilaria domingensis]|nr:ATP synthase D chain (ATP5H) [Gracilaria domingensis]
MSSALLARAVLRARAPIAHNFRRSLAAAASDAEIQQLDPSKFFQEFSDSSVRTALSKMRDIEAELLQAIDVKDTPIEWDQWKAEISYPGLVDELKAAYDASPVPDVEDARRKADEEIQATFKPIIDEFTALAKESEAETAELEKECEELTFLKDNFADMTVDEFLDRYPTVKKSIEEDIANNKWFTRDS